MYLGHFGLRTPPFATTPNTDFYVDLHSHHEALNVLRFALRSGEGFVKVTGEVGTGKTLLCRRILKNPGRGFATAYLPNPSLGSADLLAAIADELGVPLPSRPRAYHLLKHIGEALVDIRNGGRRALVLVDEAQSLPHASLEALRLLSNLEGETSKLLQVVLFGQPELDRRLRQPGLRQLRQRIAFSYRLRPIDRDAMAGYVARRLAVAGYQGEGLFAPDALNALHRASGGVPRLVNVLGNKALMSAYGRGERIVRRRDVRRAAADTESARGWLRLPLSSLGVRR